MLVEYTKERDWGSSTIRSRATRFNKLTDFLEEKIKDEELRQKVFNQLLDELGDSIMNYEFSALRNEAKSLLKEEQYGVWRWGSSLLVKGK